MFVLCARRRWLDTPAKPLNLERVGEMGRRRTKQTPSLTAKGGFYYLGGDFLFIVSKHENHKHSRGKKVISLGPKNKLYITQIIYVL